jgi:hypothetical protein
MGERKTNSADPIYSYNLITWWFGQKMNGIASGTRKEKTESNQGIASRLYIRAKYVDTGRYSHLGKKDNRK